METPRADYISNRELLLEIWRSKTSYCNFTDPKHARPDVIVTDRGEITPEVIELARAKHAAFLSTKENVVQPADVPTDDLVFRVMTEEHIPHDVNRKRRGKDGGPTKTNFPPYKHFVLDGHKLVEVGRSHWIGSASNGHFSTDHGRMSRRLADMLMRLVDRYARRGNWRGYCVDDATEALTQRGWLRHDQITTDDLILSYDNGKLRWSKIRSIFRDRYEGNMFRLTAQGMDALVTPGHKFLLDDETLCPVEFFREKDRLVLMGDALPDPEVGETLEDAFVRVVGWAATEGCFFKHTDCNHERLTIYQNVGAKADRIREALVNLGATFNEGERLRPELYRKKTPKANIAFGVGKDLSMRVRAVLGEDKSLTMPFLLALSQRQRLLLIETMVDGDGFRHAAHLLRYLQKSTVHTDSFEALCTMAGLRVSTKERAIISYGKPTTIRQVTIFGPKKSRHTMVENINMHGAKRSGARKGVGKIMHLNEPTIPYSGVVWCPETEYGTFVAKRNGCIYITSNTYVDEMKGHALLQLSQIALQFDESRSDNPFAYFTTSIRNCVAGDTLILTREYGAVPIEQVAGQDVHLLDGNGDWTLSHIHDHGEQETFTTLFQGGYESVVIRSTANHGWMRDGKRALETQDFWGRNSQVDDLRPRKIVSDDEAYRRGIVHGLIYGDGSGNPNCEDFFYIRVCSKHTSVEPYLASFPKFESPSHNGDPTYSISKAWADLKVFPQNPGANPDYLLGFLRGWFAADGCVDTRANSTICCDPSEFAWLRQWGPLVGWHARGFTPLAEVTNFGRRKKASGNVNLKKTSMVPEDFLVARHRERWNNNPSPQQERWNVYSSRHTPEIRIERVYCPEVPTTHSFALACGIHSANCFVRVLNLERKNQHIRDDLLIIAGAQPSFTRQVEHEMEMREQEIKERNEAKGIVVPISEPVLLAPKRGRKKKAA